MPPRFAAGGLAAIGTMSLAACMATSGSAGLTVPTGATLEAYGVTDVCSDDSSCFDDVQTLVDEVLGGLGDPVADPPALPSIDGAPALPLAVEAERDPAYHWEAVDGRSGDASSVGFDLSDHFLTGGEVVVNVGTSDDPHWYALPDEHGEELAQLIFEARE